MRKHSSEPRNKTILIVDDEADLLAVVEPLLAADGYRTERATDGEEALRALQRNRPDLVVLDLQMPGMNGRDVCDAIRGEEKTKWLPILVLTARTEAAEEIGCLEHGADDFLTKPFDAWELKARIHALLRRSELGRWRPASISYPN